jgi:inorganic triphosphatase YgiF
LLKRKEAQMSLEYEVKLCASKKTMEKIEQCNKLMNWDIKKSGEKHLVSHYYDTEDLKLLYNNLAFRLREDGNQKLLHLKANGTFKNGIYIREEHEYALKNSENYTSKGFLKKHFPIIVDAIKEDGLREIITIDNHRHILLFQKKNSVIETSLDFLYFVRGKRKIEHNEIELELKEGKEEDLIECYSLLQTQYNLKLAGASKYELGLRSFSMIPLL